MSDPRALRYGYTAETAPPGMRWAYEALAPTPGTQYGEILPVKKDAAGNIGFAMPTSVREGMLGMVDLLSGLDTGEVTGRGAASVTMGGLGTAMGLAPRGAVGMGGSKPPIRAYHGTKNKADILQGGFKPSSDGGTYFTDAPLDALRFADEKWTSANPSKVMRVNLNPKDMLDVDAGGQIFSPSITEEAIAAAKAGGHDSVALRNIQNFEHGSPSTTYIALDPSIIEILRKYGLMAPAPVAPPSMNVQPLPQPGFNLPNGLRPASERVY